MTEGNFVAYYRVSTDRKGEQLHAARKGVSVRMQQADAFAANVLPIIRDIENAGVTTLKGIAEALNARGIKTARGGSWHPTTVKNVLQRQWRESKAA